MPVGSQGLTQECDCQVALALGCQGLALDLQGVAQSHWQVRLGIKSASLKLLDAKRLRFFSNLCRLFQLLGLKMSACHPRQSFQILRRNTSLSLVPIELRLRCGKVLLG